MTNHLKEADGSILCSEDFVFDLELEIREEKAKELSSILTMYMTDRIHTLNVTKLENKNYRFTGMTNAHHIFLSHFSEGMIGVAVEKWDAGIEMNYELQREEVLYENGELYVEKRYREETFEDDATIEDAFEELRDVIRRRNPANGEAIYFNMRTDGHELTYDEFYTLVMSSASANEFDSALRKKIINVELTEIAFDFDKRTREMAEKVKGHLEYSSSGVNGPKLSVFLDGDFSFPGTNGETLEKMSDYINEERGYRDSIYGGEKWGEEKVKLLYKGTEVIEEIMVSTYYIKWLKEHEAYLSRGEHKVCTALIQDKGEWVDPCTLCVNRLQKEVAGCRECHFKNVKNGSALYGLGI